MLFKYTRGQVLNSQQSVYSLWVVSLNFLCPYISTQNRNHSHSKSSCQRGAISENKIKYEV